MARLPLRSPPNLVLHLRPGGPGMRARRRIVGVFSVCSSDASNPSRGSIEAGSSFGPKPARVFLDTSRQRRSPFPHSSGNALASLRGPRRPFKLRLLCDGWRIHRYISHLLARICALTSAPDEFSCLAGDDCHGAFFPCRGFLFFHFRLTS